MGFQSASVDGGGGEEVRKWEMAKSIGRRRGKREGVCRVEKKDERKKE